MLPEGKLLLAETTAASLEMAEELLQAGRPRESVALLRSVLIARPGDRQAIGLLERALFTLGQPDPDARAAAMADALELHHPALREAAAAIDAGRFDVAERLVRSVLSALPEDPSGLRLLAQLAARAQRFDVAEKILEHTLRLAPDFAAARLDLAGLLYERNRLEEAVVMLDRLLLLSPRSIPYRMLKAAALSRLGRTDEALAVYEEVLGDVPGDAAIWTLYGHALRTRGRQQDSVAAYRRAIGIDPAHGLAWFSLANLKTVQLSDDDAAAIEAALAKPGLLEEQRTHLHFALGKAREDLGEVERSFANYAEGNRLVRARSRYSAEETTLLVERSEQVFDRSFFKERAEWGAASDAPIFILGMPRSGSTLVEQILASHPAIEGTAELPYIPLLAGEIAGGDAYPDALTSLTRQRASELGEEYLARAGTHRRLGRPLFIDKNPPNWLHVGLIRTILPNARIIDVRRHPLACGFSNFKQHFASGESFANSLEDIGLYYRDYVRMMRHFDHTQPGAVHLLVYERLIEQPEAEVRRLLGHLRLPFDEACLRFWETDRVVRTYSSEQVRRPINREGIDQWRPFEPWLEPLKRKLGPEILTSHY